MTAAAREARRAEILALKPGPTMDALVTEKVMGWVRAEPDIKPEYAPLGYVLMPPSTLKPGWHVASEDVQPASDAWVLVPAYSTDLAAAWTVVEQAFWARIERTGSDWVHVEVQATVGVMPMAISAPTFPLAACRAALLAALEAEA